MKAKFFVTSMDHFKTDGYGLGDNQLKVICKSENENGHKVRIKATSTTVKSNATSPAIFNMDLMVTPTIDIPSHGPILYQQNFFYDYSKTVSYIVKIEADHETKIIEDILVPYGYTLLGQINNNNFNSINMLIDGYEL